MTLLPHLVDVIILGMALEAAVLVALWRRSHRGIAPRVLLPNLAAGACILVAMRVGLSGGWWPWALPPLLGALVAHVTDLRRRWNARGIP